MRKGSGLKFNTVTTVHAHAEVSIGAGSTKIYKIRAREAFFHATSQVKFIIVILIDLFQFCKESKRGRWHWIRPDCLIRRRRNIPKNGQKQRRQESKLTIEDICIRPDEALSRQKKSQINLAGSVVFCLAFAFGIHCSSRHMPTALSTRQKKWRRPFGSGPELMRSIHRLT